MEKGSDGLLTITTNTGIITDVDCLLFAVGRVANTDTLDLANLVGA